MAEAQVTPPSGGALRIEFGPLLADCLEPGYHAPATQVDGGASSAVFRPTRGEIWCLEGHLQDGSALRWDVDHGEEVVHLLAGTLDYDGHACPTGSTVILEAGVAAEIGCKGEVRLLHFGALRKPPDSGPFGAPSEDGRAVRVIGPRGMAEYTEPGRVARYWADGSAPTSRVTLFSSSREGPVPQPPHSHSVDEIFMITEGAIVVGRRRIEAGTVVYVAADQRYAFRGGDDGYTMINYRPDASYYTVPGVEERPIEGMTWPGITFIGEVIV